MNILKLSKITYLGLCVGVFIVFGSMSDMTSVNDSIFTGSNDHSNIQSPTSMKMYELIEKYSDQYSIPKYIAYNVAYMETRYLGPFHWKYNPYQESFAGAVGPMQIMPSTSDYINKVNYSKKRLTNDIELNVETSMKLLNKLHTRYKDWSIVCGCYNTGRPIVNDYARYCSSNRDFKDKWVSIN
jgi:soluble lytic murein transglycosylase-like protein